MKMIKLFAILLAVLLLLAACASEPASTQPKATEPTTAGATDPSQPHTCQWQAATCQTLATCTICGRTKGQLQPHAWDEGVVLKEATAEEKGEMRLTCTNCAETKLQEIPRVQHMHTYENGQVSIPSTCTNAGVMMYTCSCGRTREERIAVVAHQYEGENCAVCGIGLPSEGIEYALTEDGAGYILTGVGTCQDETVVIPNYIDGLPVVAIGERAFDSCRSMKQVVIGRNVQSIGNYAFDDCIGLTSVTIPDSVISLGQRVFNGCLGLIEVTIGNGVKTMGEWVFCNCRALTTVTIGEGLESIGAHAFNGCASLQTIRYCGSAGEWQGVEKADQWNSNMPKVEMVYDYTEE